MNKVTDFLEKHVQWIAIAIGGAIFLLALWVYVIQPDVGAEIGGREYGPGEVDRRVLNGAAGDLKLAMEPSVVPPTEEPQLATAFTKELRMAEVRTPTLPVGPLVGDLFPMSPPDDEIFDRSIDSVPTPPAATVVAAFPGRSYVEMPDGQLSDLSYTRVDLEIDPTALANLYRRIALPVRLQPTTVLRVQLERERLLPDGSYGERAVIEELAEIQDPSLPPLPDENASEDEKLAYVDFAMQNPQPILQPRFYPVEAGDDPFNLGGPDIAPAADDGIDERGFHEGFDPTDPTTWPDRDELTPQEIQAIRDAQDGGLRGGEGNEGGLPGEGGGMDGMEGMSNGTGDRGSSGSTQWQNRRRDQDRRNQGGGSEGMEGSMEGFDPAMGGMEGFDPGMMIPGDVGDMDDLPDAPSAAATMPGLVAGQFVPSDLEEPIAGWAFDTSVEPGETYRYRVTYAIKNPLFLEPDVAADPALADRLAAWSSAEASEWGSDIRVEPLNYFYMTSASADGQEVQFKVFRWQQGKWQSETFKARPGDSVGQPTGEIDYRTGSMLVDVRRDPGTNQVFALLVDDEGRFMRRTNEDRNDDQYEQLENAVASAASADE